MSATASAPADKASAITGTGAAAPEIFWAQRSSEDEPEKNIVMVTINVPNLPPAPATKIDLTEKGFNFHARVGDKSKGIAEREYAFQLDLFDEIDPKESKISQNSKAMHLVLRKSKAQLEYWPRLSKDKVRLHNVKTDFDKWVDEDEQTGNMDDIAGLGDGGMGGMDPSMMGGMGGMPGMGGAGGMGGMDLQAMMAQMQQGGGMGGMGGEGMPDFGAMAGGYDESDDDDDDVGAASSKGKGKSTDADLLGSDDKVEELSTEGVSKAKDVDSVD